MKNSGFILIEFLIALFIGSALSISMMGSLIMMQKNNAIVDGFIDVYGSVGRLQQQLERDISGVVMPLSFLQAQPAGEKKEEKVPGEKKETEPEKKTVEPVKKQNNYAFFATKKENTTDVLTFITTNPISSYWSDKAGQVKSRLARVVYRLEPDKEQPKLFRLMRQEGMDLDFKNYASNAAKPIRALEIARGIKKYAMQFMVEADRSEEKEGEQKKVTVTYKVLDEWRVEEQKEDPKNKKKVPKVPRFVRLALTVVDERQAREETFECTFPILCDVDTEAPKKPAPPKPPGPLALNRMPPRPGGIRDKLASLRPSSLPGGLLGRFSQAMKGLT